MYLETWKDVRVSGYFRGQSSSADGGGGDKPDHVDTYSSSIGALFLF